ncbi:uncharacterized protein LOC144027107 [Festucalex cinctus]
MEASSQSLIHSPSLMSCLALSCALCLPLVFLPCGAPLVVPVFECPFCISSLELFLFSLFSLFERCFEFRYIKTAALLANCHSASESYLLASCQYTSASMDPAEKLVAALRQQAARLSHTEEAQQAMVTRMGELAGQVQELVSHLQHATPNVTKPETAELPIPTTVVSGAGLRLASPERYSGDQGQCQAFLTECDIHFELSPQAFPTDRSRVAFMISHLTGRARDWATAEWARHSPTCSTAAGFSRALRLVFDPTNMDREKTRELSNLRQGRESVNDYAIRFRTLAAKSGWNDTALFDHFLKGLSTAMQELLLPVDLPGDLDSLISLAIRTGHRRRDLLQTSGHQRGHGSGFFWHPEARGPPQGALPQSPTAGRPSESDEEPMQLDRARLSHHERQRRRQEGRCYYCGERGHLVVACPTKRGPPVTSETPKLVKNRKLTQVTISCNATSTDLLALIDSGADESLMDWGLTRKQEC